MQSSASSSERANPDSRVRLTPEGGSFRDPGGAVFRANERIIRTIESSSRADWEYFRASPLFEEFQREQLVVSTQDLPADDELYAQCATDHTTLVVEHERIPFISYPYEWSFGMLQRAALLHLEILERALPQDLVLKDATAFNVQFIGPRPIFIDLLSFVRWDPGDPWIGYNQFCKMFLFPLMLQAYKNVPFHSWLRGELEGFDPVLFSRLVGVRDLFRPGVFAHVLMQAWMQRRLAGASHSTRSQVKSAGLSKNAILNNIRNLRKIVSKLKFREERSAWIDYTNTHTYTEVGLKNKEDFVGEIVQRRRRRLVWDLGCNTGHFTRLAAKHSEYVVGLEADHASVERLFQSLASDKVGNALPLVVNLANSSPDQGWAGHERRNLAERGRPNLILCLALLHHIVISANIPVGSFVDWLADLCDEIVIEFIGKDDDMVKRLLLNKDDTYSDYEQLKFEEHLKRRFVIERRLDVPGGTRFLYFARVNAV